MPTAYFDGAMKPQTATFLDLTRPYLAEVEACMRPDSSDHHPALGEAIDHLLDSGGKRIRPTVVLLIGNMLGAEPERLITHAAAIEMLHTATLVHDDLIDGSLLRRGIPTLNARWGPGATVLTGDYIFARAAQLAAQTRSLQLMEAFARALITIVNGEITQLFDHEVHDYHQSYYKRIYAKTASLFEVASEGAALLADCDPNCVEAMRSFGYNIGLAFQIVDDVLDFTGDQLEVGKPVGNDLRQGLITLPTVIHFQDQPQGSQWLQKLRQQEVQEEELEVLIDEIRNSSAINQSIEEAQQFIQDGEARLEDMPACPERDALFDLARYVVLRTA
jgi:geranylgeranyl pyrophosphate synthase